MASRPMLGLKIDVTLDAFLHDSEARQGEVVAEEPDRDGLIAVVLEADPEHLLDHVP